MEAETKINQRKQQIEAETAKKVAETQAQQRLAVAEVNLQTSKKEAEATLAGKGRSTRSRTHIRETVRFLWGMQQR